MRRCLIFLIRIYQHLLAGFNFRACRFYPSCSQYWIEALEKYGFLRGMGKGVLRLFKCHPYTIGGYDPP